MRVHRRRASGAGRVARRSFAGWALVATARQGGELAPCGRSDSVALPPRLRSSHPAKFASGPAPRARGPSPPHVPLRGLVFWVGAFDSSACVSGIRLTVRTSACYPKRGPSPIHTREKLGPSPIPMA